MIEDARALVALAESLAATNAQRAAAAGALQPRPATMAPAGAVLVHAVSLHGKDVAFRSASAPVGDLPIIVLLDDAPAVPDFLPDGVDVDLDDPTDEAVRGAIVKRVRDALQRSPVEFHVLDLVESIQDAVIVIDRQSTVSYLNASATALLQTLTRRSGPFVGQPLAKVFPPALSASARPAIQNALDHASASRVEDPERHHGIALDIAIFPHPQGATLLVRDVTRRRDIEAELIETRSSLARAESRLRARDDEASA